ncbi:MAG: DUF2442 domain-containing protein [Candidatus Binataceae bacterium]
MDMIRICAAKPLDGRRLGLTLTDGRAIERDVSALLRGPMFDRIRADRSEFVQVHAVDGTVAWPNGADLCPDVLIWGGAPPEQEPDAASSKSGASART